MVRGAIRSPPPQRPLCRSLRRFAERLCVPVGGGALRRADRGQPPDARIAAASRSARRGRAVCVAASATPITTPVRRRASAFRCAEARCRAPTGGSFPETRIAAALRSAREVPQHVRTQNSVRHIMAAERGPPMPQTNAPNQIDLQGPGLTISYSTSGLAGKPQLSLKKGRQAMSFSGKEIDTVTTQIGTLITVPIAKTVDRDITTFSFL